MSDTPPNYVPYASPRPSNDLEHLRLIALFHYIYGGLVALLCSFALIYFVLGIMMIRNPAMFQPAPGQPPMPAGMGYAFMIGGGLVVLFGWTMGALSILSGRCIGRRRARTFSFIVAGINCLWVPFGTILAIFTFIVLLRPTVAALYSGNRAPVTTY